MKIGTKSLLFGAHQFIIHPIFVFIAWWRLYGFPYDPRLWIVFIVHDWGYFGLDNMDGETGEMHPVFGARLVSRLFDNHYLPHPYGLRWYYLSLFHSRFLAKKVGMNFSKLCVADKYAFVITPKWIYLPCVWLSGEYREYIDRCKPGEKFSGEVDHTKNTSLIEWHNQATAFTAKWVNENKLNYG